MEITQRHMTFLTMRNRFFPEGVTKLGLFNCRNSHVQTEVFDQPERMRHQVEDSIQRLALRGSIRHAAVFV